MLLEANQTFIPASALVDGDKITYPRMWHGPTGRQVWLSKEEPVTLASTYVLYTQVGVNAPTRTVLPAGSQIRLHRVGSPSSPSVWDVTLPDSPEQIPFDEGESVPVDPRAVVTAIDDEVDGHTVIFAWRDHSTPFHAFDLSVLGDVAAAGSSAPGAGWAVLRGESKLQTGDLIGPHGWEER